jgi:hypothetical protein
MKREFLRHDTPVEYVSSEGIGCLQKINRLYIMKGAIMHITYYRRLGFLLVGLVDGCGGKLTPSNARISNLDIEHQFYRQSACGPLERFILLFKSLDLFYMWCVTTDPCTDAHTVLLLPDDAIILFHREVN